jgi:hypothetical protein
MKKFVWTAIATVIITVSAVFGWDRIVVDHFGFYNYPEWMAYGLICICAYAGGMVGGKLSMIDWNVRRWIRVYNDKFITKELR